MTGRGSAGQPLYWHSSAGGTASTGWASGSRAGESWTSAGQPRYRTIPPNNSIASIVKLDCRTSVPDLQLSGSDTVD
jgi:hypothetical protein